ncbi:MAG: DUF4097 family beta strand repeat-containing protein [Bacteroidota bacterium]
MKKTMITVLALTTVSSWCTAQRKEFKETLTKEVTFTTATAENTLVVWNIYGPVSVEGYNGNAIQVKVEKEIFADNAEDLEVGKTELTLKVVAQDNRIIIHPDAPYIQYDEKGLRFNWCDNYEEPVYQHRLSFTIKVPKGINLNVAAVNDGDISVANTSGKFIKVNNINGGIDLENVVGKTNLHCINGRVNVSYASNPDVSSKYYSLNGDINISYQEPLSADVSFKSMNGELFTDFAIEKQYVRTSKNEDGKRKTKFKYESTPIVQIGSGGIALDFETLNGNVFIKKM